MFQPKETPIGIHKVDYKGGDDDNNGHTKQDAKDGNNTVFAIDKIAAFGKELAVFLDLFILLSHLFFFEADLLLQVSHLALFGCKCFFQVFIGFGNKQPFGAWEFTVRVSKQGDNQFLNGLEAWVFDLLVKDALNGKNGHTCNIGKFLVRPPQFNALRLHHIANAVNVGNEEIWATTAVSTEFAMQTFVEWGFGCNFCIG